MSYPFHLFTLNRREYYPQTTIGDLELLEEGSAGPIHFGYTLEDTVRAYGIKVKGDTAVPHTTDTPKGDGFYNVGIRYSPKFKRDVVVFYSKKTGEVYETSGFGITFFYTLFHGANSHKDVEGCSGIAKNKNGNKIQGSLSNEIVMKVKELLQTCDVKLRIINHSQKN